MTIKQLRGMFIAAVVGLGMWAGIWMAVSCTTQDVETSVWDGVVVVDGQATCLWNLPCYDRLIDPGFEG